MKGVSILRVDFSTLVLDIAKQWANLYCEIWKDPPWNEDFWVPKRVMREIYKEVNFPHGEAFLALADDRVIGFTHGYSVTCQEMRIIAGNGLMNKFFKRSERVYYVDELGVAKEFRGKQISLWLSRSLIHAVQDHGLSCMLLRTDKQAVAARHLYSKLGLHMNDFIVVMRTSVNDWGTGKFSALELFFSYGGLELGDAAYLLIPQANRSAIPISDIGFGLERMAWAVNKTDSYFDTLMPWTASGAREMFDSCRTIALLVLCGVQAANKGPGLQFRRFAKVLGEKYYGVDVYSILTYYFDYWAQFIKPSISRESAIQLARLEIERFVNLKVCETLRLPPPRDETTEAYFDRLVYTCNTNVYELRKALKTCKT